MPANDEQIHVLNAASMMRPWLADKVERGAVTQAPADALWRRYTRETKFVANYFSVGDDVALMTKLAREVQRQRQGVLYRGAERLGNLAKGLVDLAADAAMDYVRRQFDRNSWRILPRF